MRSCGFCGGPGVNKEHLWPNWLRKVILASRSGGGQKKFRAQLERGGRTISFVKPSLEIEVGMPCKTCNEGWMHRLEEQVKSFMTDMVDRGLKTLLDDYRQTLLTRWIIKTAMVYEFTDPLAEQKYFSEGDRKAFKESFALPSNLWIWLARYDGVMPVHSLQLRAPKLPDVVPNVYSMTLGANFLLAQVFAYRAGAGDLSQIPLATKGPRLHQLYPRADGWLTWPPEKTIDDDELQVLDYRFRDVIGGTVV